MSAAQRAHDETIIQAALDLLRYMVEVEDGPCRHDHHGYCQEHPGGFRANADDVNECWIAAARAIIAAVEQETMDDDRVDANCTRRVDNRRTHVLLTVEELAARDEAIIHAALHSWTGVHVAPLTTEGYDTIIKAAETTQQ